MTASKLSRIMPNIKGPSQTTRNLVATVAYTQAFYAVPLFNYAIQDSSILRKQSTSSASVLVGIPPINLMSKERTEIQYEKFEDNVEPPHENIWNKLI